MEYSQIKVSFRTNPKQFNRVIAIHGDPSLDELGVIIGKSINAWFEHCYLFRCPSQNKNYIPDSWVDGTFEEDVPLSKYHLSDLEDTFSYEYDTGEGYDFNCKKLKRKIYCEPDEDEPEIFAFVVKGVGQGIFENDIYTLYRYLDGEIDPNSDEESEEPWQNLPMNMSFDKYGDFDEPLDLDEYVYYKDEICDLVKRFTERNPLDF